MSLSSLQLTLLEAARAEAKRAGHDQVAPVHLAAALARRDPERFEEVFGPGSREALRDRLRQAPRDVQPDEAEALLRETADGDPRALLRALHARIGALDGNGAGPSAAAPTTDDEQEDEEPHAELPEYVRRLVATVEPDPSVEGRDELVAEVLALLGRRRPATPLLVGPEGSGKSAVGRALASAVARDDHAGPLAGTRVMRLVTEEILAGNPPAELDRALDAMTGEEIVIVDDLEVLTSLGMGVSIPALFARLRAAVAHAHLKLVLIVDEAFVSRLEGADEELATEVVRLPVEPLPTEALTRIAERVAPELAEHHGVTLPDATARLALAPPAAGDHHAHPGLLIERLDTACSRAALRPDRTVTDADLRLESTPEVGPPDPAALAERLRRRVRGQDHVLERVASRLALTRARLDLRPERPDGVFLLVGPTGVGKTELARALCEVLFGDEERLIRLDMSEYAQGWALSRLIGPQPGYVGFTEPDSWLTTRVRAQPETVVLLDEIEKADPSVWNAFLQVFDAGRLSDSRGNVADFGRAVVLMTSNLGAKAFGETPLGFARDEDPEAVAAREDSGVLEAVRRIMPPEFVNRFDDVIVFRPLTREAILEIAHKEMDALAERLTERGYRVSFGEDVVRLVADHGYEPALGARHLHRNLEHMVLQPLALAEGRDLVATVDGDEIRWAPRPPG